MRSQIVMAIFFLAGAAVVQAIGESCKDAQGVAGTCIDTSQCSGTITAKKCPGADNIKCCTYPKCTVGSDSGVCKKTSACRGKTTPGKCKGPDDIRCCTNEDGAEDEEDEGKETPSDPKWQTGVKIYEGVDEYLPALAKQWCEKRPDTCQHPDDMLAWLRKELDETIQGGSYRMGSKYPGDLHMGRGFIIGMQEQMWFQNDNPGKSLGTFEPPKGVVLRANPEWVIGSDTTPLAHVSDFLVLWSQTIRKHWTGALQVSTYKNHGGGKFDGAGFSADLMVGSIDDLGFYKRENAVAFLKAVHAACKEIKCEWRMIYNDFTVADEINRFYGYKHVIFGGSPTWNEKKQRFTNLNWHGPSPLILHMHLDIAPKASGPLEGKSITPARIAENTRAVPLPPKPPAPGTGTPCKVGNIDATCVESKDCKGTVFSGLCPHSVKCCLPAGKYPSCTAKTVPGVCKPTKECKGKTHSGFCKDMPSAWKCCTGESSLIEEDDSQNMELPQAPEEEQEQGQDQSESSSFESQDQASDATQESASASPASDDSSSLPEAPAEDQSEPEDQSAADSSLLAEDDTMDMDMEMRSRPNLFVLQPMED